MKSMRIFAILAVMMSLFVASIAGAQTTKHSAAWYKAHAPAKHSAAWYRAHPTTKRSAAWYKTHKK